VLAAVELGRRTLTVPDTLRPRFATPRDAALYLLPHYGAYPVERFGVLLLDTRHRLISTRVLSVGSLDASLGHPREVFREALLAGAAAVVAFHNHPSGDPIPSRDDVSLTERLQQAGSVVGVPLVDHVILADDRYCSLREMGLI
jgi:DNA repair protein RadC